MEAAGEGVEVDFDAAVDGTIEDDLLRLVFTACHPLLSSEARVTLTLRLLGGVTTDEVARAFLVPTARATPARARAARRTGCASPRCTTLWPNSPRRRLSS